MRACTAENCQHQGTGLKTNNTGVKSLHSVALISFFSLQTFFYFLLGRRLFKVPDSGPVTPFLPHKQHCQLTSDIRTQAIYWDVSVMSKISGKHCAQGGYFCVNTITYCKGSKRQDGAKPVQLLSSVVQPLCIWLCCCFTVCKRWFFCRSINWCLFITPIGLICLILAVLLMQWKQTKNGRSKALVRGFVFLRTTWLNVSIWSQDWWCVTAEQQHKKKIKKIPPRNQTAVYSDACWHSQGLYPMCEPNMWA